MLSKLSTIVIGRNNIKTKNKVENPPKLKMSFKVINIAEFFFALYMAIKYSIFAVLQSYQEYQKYSPKTDSHLSAIQSFLRDFGSINRQLGALGVHFNIMFAGIPLCFYYPVIFRKINFTRFLHPNRMRESIALASSRLAQPTRSGIVEPKGGTYLSRLLHSKEMLAKESGALRISLLLAKSNSLRQTSIKHLRKTDTRVAPLPIEHQTTINFEKNYLHQAILDERRRASLYRDCSIMAEHRRLLELFKDGDRISLWNDLKVDGSLTKHTVYLASFWGILIWAELCVGYSQLLACQALSEEPGKQDYLAIVEQFAIPIVGVRYVAPLLTEIILGFRFNMKALNCIENRFKAHLRHNAAFINSSNKFNHKKITIENLASEAIELFVVIQKFAQNIDHFFQRTRFILGSALIFVGSAEVPTVILMDRADPAQLSVLVVTSIVLVMVSNGVFFSYSVFSAACVRVSKLIWTLIANSLYYQTINSNRHTKGSLMSPFTLMLWRKFVEDKEMLTNTFTITILGYLRLNYSSVIRLNIWMFNIVLLFAGPFRASRMC